MRCKGFVLVRHGAYGTDDRGRDAGLNLKGFEQMEKVGTAILKEIELFTPEFFCGPALRNQQSAHEIAATFRMDARIRPCLGDDEKEVSENTIAEMTQLVEDSKAEFVVMVGHLGHEIFVKQFAKAKFKFGWEINQLERGEGIIVRWDGQKPTFKYIPHEG